MAGSWLLSAPGSRNGRRSDRICGISWRISVSRFGLVQDEAGHWVNKGEKDDERALARAYAAELDKRQWTNSGCGRTVRKDKLIPSGVPRKQMR